MRESPFPTSPWVPAAAGVPRCSSVLGSQTRHSVIASPSPVSSPCLVPFKDIYCGFRAHSGPRWSRLRCLSEYQLQRPRFQTRSHAQVPGRHTLAEASTQPTTIVEPGLAPGGLAWKSVLLASTPKPRYVEVLCFGFCCCRFQNQDPAILTRWSPWMLALIEDNREREQLGGSPFLGLFVCVTTPDRPGFMVRRMSLISSLDPELNEPVSVDKHATTTSKWALLPHGSATLCQLWMIPERNACFRVSKRTSRTF